MHEAVERLEPDLAVGRFAQADDDPVNGALAKARADKMPESDVEAVGNAVGEGASGSAQAGEDGDLCRADHRGYSS